MKQLLFLLGIVSALGFSACNKFKTDATTGREFLLRQGPRTQRISPPTPQFTGEGGMTFIVDGPYISLTTGDTITGTPEFWLVEYLTKKDMMFGGLPTTSGSQILATGGAFSLATRVNGELVRPGSIDFRVPADSNNPAMDAFRGGLNGESTFDWTTLSSPVFQNLWWIDTTGLGSGGPGYQGYINPLQNWMYNSSMYVNCDYFLNSSDPLTSISVRPSSETNFTPIQLSTSILFELEEVFMAGEWNGLTDMFDFINLPIGTQVTCLAVGVNNENELFFGMMDLVVEEDGVYTFQLNPITEEELEDILEGL